MISAPAAETVGADDTVPAPVASFTVVAPVLVHAIFPLAPFEAEEVNLTYTLDEATDPLDCVKVTLDPKPEPEVLETSYPVGAVTVMSFVKLFPEMVKLCSVPAEPEHDVKVEKDDDVVIKGVDVTSTTSDP